MWCAGFEASGRVKSVWRDGGIDGISIGNNIDASNAGDSANSSHGAICSAGGGVVVAG